MSQNKKASFRQLLSRLAVQVQRGEPEAIGQISSLLEKLPGEANLLHLAGLHFLNAKQFPQAIDYFRQSLRQAPEQAELHNNLANALQANTELTAAEKHYRKALQLRPEFHNAWKNLGLLLLVQQKFKEAEEALLKALGFTPQDVSVLTALGNTQREQERFNNAVTYYKQAIELSPSYTNALHNLGACYKALEQPQEALRAYEQAQRSAPKLSAIDLSIGSIMFDLGRYEQSEAHLLGAIKKSPQKVELHEALSELYWQTGRHDEIEHSFRDAIRVAPQNMAMRLSLLRLLIAGGFRDKAKQLARESLKLTEDPKILHLQGKLFAGDLNYESAEIVMRQSLEREFQLECAQDLIKLHIIRFDYDLALDLIETTQQRFPLDQLSWALKGLCWRLQGDERYRWLIDYKEHIRSYTLATPNAYAELADFLSELEVVLLAMHSTQFAPSQQTLKEGTQTPGRLLHKKHPLIQTYKKLLEEVVGDYIAHLPNDPSHPLLSRKSQQFRFSGSWSVKLRSGGFHVNHVHPQGWISSACYITIPVLASTSSNATPASIKFGESGLGLGDREVVERIIQPSPGQLVLFPSYTWHGTYDFSAKEEDFRLTAPFDVVPC